MSRITHGAVALTTGALVAGLCGPAFAATAPKPTSLTLKAAKSSVAPRQKDTLTGTLKSGTHLLANESVTLEKRAAGAAHFTVVTTKKTDSSGRVSLTVVPGTRKGQKEQYELVFAGNPTYKGSHSSVITLTVS